MPFVMPALLAALPESVAAVVSILVAARSVILFYYWVKRTHSQR
jgi:hypothetical protein